MKVPSRTIGLLGPAFVAAIAYVDPGNVAANITAGAKYGYLLVWVLVVANVMAVMVQYQSAKLGVVTGKTLPETLGERLSRRGRLMFWGQAELVAGATDIAEVIGGAIALHLLFGLPLPVGGVIVGVVSIALLALANPQRQRQFEHVIVGLLAVIVVGFLAGLFVSPPDAAGIVHGMMPRLEGAETVLLAASMLGATVMPHAIYLHSSLVIDRHGRQTGERRIRGLLSATSRRRHRAGDRRNGQHRPAGAGRVESLRTRRHRLHRRRARRGPGRVGARGGGRVRGGPARLGHRFDLGRFVRGRGHHDRSDPQTDPHAGAALGDPDPRGGGARDRRQSDHGTGDLTGGAELRHPFAIIPLRRYTADKTRMGVFADGPWLRWGSAAAVAAIVTLNVALIVLTITGAG